MYATLNKRVKEGVFLLSLALGAFFLLALISYSPEDPSWGYVGPRDGAINAGGPVGAWFSSVLFALVGVMAFLFPFMIAWAGYLFFRDRENNSNNPYLTLIRWVGFFLILIGSTGLSALHAKTGMYLPEGPGGILGHLGMDITVTIISAIGATIFMLSAFLIGFTLFTGLEGFIG